MIEHQRPVYWNDLFGPGPGRDSDSRLNTFIRISDKYPDDIYWQALADCYQSSDNVGRISRVALRQLFTANRTGREMLMNEDQKKFYHLLPETVTIYRGMTEKERRSGDYGISWTLDKAMASFFAFKYIRNYAFANEPKCVLELSVPKTRIIAYWNERREQEIIYI